jgi:hypothetical protein
VSAFFAPELWPFAVAAGLMIIVTIAEAIGMVAGMSMSHWADGFAVDHPDGIVSGALGWLHFGKVPILIIVVIFLMTFALTGFISQFAVRSMFGFYMPVPVAMLFAGVTGVLGVRVLGGAIRRFVPQDETNAVSDASLVGRVGVVTIGNARVGKPAEARVRDEHGASHYVMVEPEELDQSFDSGTSILLVRHLGGRRFQAIHNPKPGLL